MNKALGYISAIFKTTICIALFLICQMSALFLFDAAGLDRKVYEGSFIAIYSVVIIIVFLIYSAISSYRKNRLVMREKLDIKRILMLILMGFALLGLVSMYMIIANLISEYVSSFQGELDKYSESMDRFSSVSVDEVPWWDPVLDALATSFIVPFAEELVFRGAVFGELSRRINWVLSAVISSAIFGLFHGISIHIGYALISGMILCVVYQYTKSIFASYIMHATFNLFGSAIFTFLDSSIMSGVGINQDRLNLSLLIIEILAIWPAAIGMYFTIYRPYKLKQVTIKEQL